MRRATASLPNTPSWRNAHLSYFIYVKRRGKLSAVFYMQRILVINMVH
jgi:hypothetical protein